MSENSLGLNNVTQRDHISVKLDSRFIMLTVDNQSKGYK